VPGAWPSSRWWEGLSKPLALRLISFTAGEETCPKSTYRGKWKDIYTRQLVRELCKDSSHVEKVLFTTL